MIFAHKSERRALKHLEGQLDFCPWENGRFESNSRYVIGQEISIAPNRG